MANYFFCRCSQFKRRKQKATTTASAMCILIASISFICKCLHLQFTIFRLLLILSPFFLATIVVFLCAVLSAPPPFRALIVTKVLLHRCSKCGFCTKCGRWAKTHAHTLELLRLLCLHGQMCYWVLLILHLVHKVHFASHSFYGWLNNKNLWLKHKHKHQHPNGKWTLSTVFLPFLALLLLRRCSFYFHRC